MLGENSSDIQNTATDYLDHLGITDTELATLVFRAKFSEAVEVIRSGREWTIQYLYETIGGRDLTKLIALLTDLYDSRMS